MDKAELVFEKLSGAKLDAIKAFGKGLFGLGKNERAKSVEFLRKSVKGEAPYAGVANKTTPRIEKVKKMYGSGETATSQRLREMQQSKMVNTYGKPGVAKAWTAGDKVKGVAKERMLRELGI